MPFVPGMQKSGGRTKGTLNKLTMAAPQRLAELGVDPFKELLKIAKTTTDENVKARCYSIMLEYCYPKRRAVEHSGKVEHTAQVDMRAAIMAVIQKLPEDTRSVVAREMIELEKVG